MLKTGKLPKILVGLFFITSISIHPSHWALGKEKKIYHIALSAKQTHEFGLQDFNRAFRVGIKADQKIEQVKSIVKPATLAIPLLLLLYWGAPFNLFGTISSMVAVGIVHEPLTYFGVREVVYKRSRVKFDTLNIAIKTVLENGREACELKKPGSEFRFFGSSIEPVQITAEDLRSDHFEYYYYGKPLVAYELKWMEMNDRPHFIFRRLKCESVELSPVELKESKEGSRK